MRQINTLIKPTHECNMRCKYCFHEQYGYKNSILDIDKLKKYLNLLSIEYDFINIIWHGGEPLMVPLDYYEEIYDHCEKLNSRFLFTIQTNGSLITQKNIDFFKERQTNFGLSFDGLKNENTRSHTEEIKFNIKLLQKNNFNPGAILVVNNSNVSDLIDEYKYFDSLGLSMKLNPMFSDGAAKLHPELALDPDEYIEKFVNFFKYWSTDSNGKINVATCNELTNLIINEHSGVCTFNSCLTKWLCLDSSANIYPCDRLCSSEYLLGNVENVSSIKNLFISENFIELLKSSINRRENCIKICDFYKNCYSGCNANAFLGVSDDYENGVSCYIQKGILEGIKDYVLNSLENHKTLNPTYEKILKKK